MASMSDYLRNALANHVLRATPYPVPSTVYLALWTAAPDANGGGAEVSGGSYARKPVTFSVPNLGVTNNSGLITFTNMPAAVVVAGTLMDALTNGNILFFGIFSSSRTIAAGTDATFNPAEINIAFA